MVIAFLKSLKLPPVVFSAAGAVIGFYFLFYAHTAATAAVLSVLLVTLCLFRVLSSLNEQSRTLRLMTVCSAVFTAGVVLGICAAHAGRGETAFGIQWNKVTGIEGVLTEDPRLISGGRAAVTLSLKRSAGEKGLRASGKGEITVFFPQWGADKLREYGRGTTVFAEGNLRRADSGWTYSADSLHIVKTAPAAERMRTNIRLNLQDRFDDKPWGGLSLALLLGIKDNLDTNLSSLYRNAGCSFILALSGMHLAVIAAIIAFLLKKPLGLKLSALVGAFLIVLYCFLVGPMPSLIRAAIMYLLGVIAILSALPKKPPAILCLSFLIQIVVTPSAGNSISFMLSYLALAGILLIGQPVYSLFSGKVPDFILSPVSASCGAFLATAGITCYSFGIIAPVGILAGLIIVPLTTIFMIGSMLWLLFDLLRLSVLLSFPLSLLYNLMEKIVSAAGGVPRIAAPPPLILTLSLLLSITIVLLEHRRQTISLRLEQFS